MATTQMTPMAMAILGLEPPPRRRREDTEIPATENMINVPTICSTAQDNPPVYPIATRHKAPVRHPGEGREVLPRYTSTINAEAKLLLQLESINPLHGIAESEWREVYVVVRGTLLSIFRVKDGGAGKLLRSYTLQHAEVGLASDTQHTVLIPQTRLAHLIPVSARRRAWQKDPDLFQPLRQTILRLRIETDQILLADASEDRIHDLIHAISAGVDISFAIDERCVPRQCTVPRRRRRQRLPVNGNLTDPALLEEQERILRDMYPAFAEQPLRSPRQELQRTNTEDTPSEPLATSAREEDDLDFAVMREDFATPHAPAPSQDLTVRPAMSRTTTASSIVSTLSADMLYATSPSNFTAKGKWQPPHPRTALQIQRYARRCMPVLHAESVRASDVLICHGKRVKINWRMELLEEWELNPPSYKSHGFNKPANIDVVAANGVELQRTRSQSSQSPSATNSGSPHSSRSVLGGDDDRIEPIGTSLANLDLAKVAENVELKSPTHPTMPSTPSELEIKTQEARHPGTEVHGVVFCF